MQRLILSAGLVALFMAPATARADFIFEGSAGMGYQVKPTAERLQNNIMVAPGYGIGTMVRAELGFVAGLADSKYDSTIELRPMFVFSPPVVPVFGRLIFAVTDVAGDPSYAYGGSLGLDAELLDTLGIFAEVGLLPRSVDNEMTWVTEGRVGAYFVL